MFKRDEVPLSPLSNLYPYQTAGMMYPSAPGFFSSFPPVWGIDLVVIITIKFIDRSSVRKMEMFKGFFSVYTLYLIFELITNY